jgi:hypothetical protein
VRLFGSSCKSSKRDFTLLGDSYDVGALFYALMRGRGTTLGRWRRASLAARQTRTLPGKAASVSLASFCTASVKLVTTCTPGAFILNFTCSAS